MQYATLPLPQEATIRPDSLAVIRDAAEEGGITTLPRDYDRNGLVPDLRYNALADVRLPHPDSHKLLVELTGEGRRVLAVLDNHAERIPHQ